MCHPYPNNIFFSNEIFFFFSCLLLLLLYHSILRKVYFCYILHYFVIYNVIALLLSKSFESCYYLFHYTHFTYLLQHGRYIRIAVQSSFLYTVYKNSILLQRPAISDHRRNRKKGNI